MLIAHSIRFTPAYFMKYFVVKFVLLNTKQTRLFTYGIRYRHLYQ